jgi:hypothetical protein
MPTPSNSLPPGTPKSRAVLRNYFKRGSLPTEQSFADLINSAVNRLDDGFAYSAQDGWQVAAPDETTRLLALYQDLKRLEANQPSWFVELFGVEAAPSGLSFSIPPADPEAETDAGLPPAAGPAAAGQPTKPASISRLHLQANGRVGVGTTTPAERLDVVGFVASEGRIGTYRDQQKPGTEVPADGGWHPILTNLTGLHAFEIVAAAYGPEGKGRYAITHATALSAYGARRRIYHQDAWFWGWFQKIQFRWTGDQHGYGLEMRTASPFGDDSRIVYHITHLFDNRRPAATPPAGSK